jgi:hypothetical protein
MKQFLLVGIAVLFVSANASENPFDLKENFGKIDSDQEVLLSELRKLAELKELAQEKEEVAEPERVVPVEVPLPPVEKEESSPVLDDVVAEVEVQVNEVTEAQVLPTPPMAEESTPSSAYAVIAGEEVDNARFEKIRQNVMESEKKKLEAQAQQIEDTRVEEENRVLAANIKEKEAEIEKVKAQREAERLEVEAYEKERAEKLAQKAETEALEKEKLAQQEAREKRLAKKEAMKQQEIEDAAKAMETTKRAETVENEVVAQEEVIAKKEATSVDDINITREESEAKIAADLAYAEAVIEMDMED